jgi:DNA repair exonuclease SbcCD ATPase subunit
MILTKVKLENFKKFKEIEREFIPGINVVKGPLNEMGKSTLLDGIVVALFENPKSTKKELERYMTWGSSRRCNTVIEFEVQGEKYLLEKNFDMKTMQFTAIETGEEWNTPSEIAERLRELLGTDSPTLFLSTSCIRQNEVTDILSGKKEIGESLEGIVTGGTEETVASQVINNIAKQINTLTKGLDRPTKSPGPIARLNYQVDSLRKELKLVKEEVARVERQKVTLVEVSHEIGQVVAQLAEAEALLEKNKRRRQIEETIDKLEKDYEKIDGLVGDIGLLNDQIREAESKLQAIEGFGDMQKVLEVNNQLLKLEANRKNIGDDLQKR